MNVNESKIYFQHRPFKWPLLKINTGDWKLTTFLLPIDHGSQSISINARPINDEQVTPIL